MGSRGLNDKGVSQEENWNPTVLGRGYSKGKVLLCGKKVRVGLEDSE